MTLGNIADLQLLTRAESGSDWVNAKYTEASACHDPVATAPGSALVDPLQDHDPAAIARDTHKIRNPKSQI